MEIKGKVHCFFEQSGTFKNEFIKLGVQAEDYDIQNDFGQTDHLGDLFLEIEKAWRGVESIFDNISKDDLIFAFFPCIYFEALSMIGFTLGNMNYRKLENFEKVEKILEREQKRHDMYRRLLKLFGVCFKRGLRLIVENPYALQHYLKNGNFLFQPQYVDNDRTRRGDYFVKPTAFWFCNCEPTHGFTMQKTPKDKVIRVLSKPGARNNICSEERSMISPEYARNFICDNILGITQQSKQLTLF